MTKADAITIAQLKLNTLVHGSNEFALLTNHIEENHKGWIIPWANKEVITQGVKALRVGGNCPFFVDRESQGIYSYSDSSNRNFDDWYQVNVSVS